MTKLLKAFLIFNENQKPAPNFMVVYLLTWLIWHNHLFVTFFTSEGDLGAKSSATLLAMVDNQYVVVLWLTCFVLLVRLGYIFIQHKSREIIESDEPIEQKVGSDQYFEKNQDIQRLMALLDETKESLAKVKEREKKLIAEKSVAAQKLLIIQNELEGIYADNTVLTRLNQKLKAQLPKTNSRNDLAC